MIIRAKAPLRLGFAGGGTDVSPYCDEYGGSILNATINMYAYATIDLINGKNIVLCASDRKEYFETEVTTFIPYNGTLDLLKAVYNRLIKDFAFKPQSFRLTTYVDAPAGSGLGSSSTLVVAILKAFVEWLNLPLDDYGIAQLAWSIEREDLAMSGGLQDQYAAAFGGFNFMQFKGHQNVLVNPLRIKRKYLDELEINLLLYYTGTSRLSSKIINSQISNVKNKTVNTLAALNKIKQSSYDMKEALLMGRLNDMGYLLNEAWINKKATSTAITNPIIDELYETALDAGATGGKISGAGGGGFFMFFCPELTRYSVIEALKKYDGEFKRFTFTDYGAQSWKY
ncbi:MAG: dehydrogenase [Alphaproteobacteria bacterium]|nr:dehydrogenase [Alphaproteobacteria bacterium]